MAISVKSVPTSNADQGKGETINNPLIKKACTSAKHKDLCIKTLKSEPKSGNADMKTLAFMSLNRTTTLGVSVGDWIAQKLEDPELGPKVEQALTDCAEQYTDAIAQLEDSLVAFFANALNDVQTWTSTAMTNANTCQEGLKEANAGNVMAKRNEIFSQYCSISLAVINEFAKQKV